MRVIKTRNTVEGIKVLNKSISHSKRMKDAAIRKKERTAETQSGRYDSPTEYATGHVQETVRETVYYAPTPLPLPKASQSWNRAKEHFQEVKRNQPKERQRAAEQAQKIAIKTRENAETLKTTAENAQETAQHAKTGVRDAKQTLRETRQVGRQTLREVKQKAKIEQKARIARSKTIKTKEFVANTKPSGVLNPASSTVNPAVRAANSISKPGISSPTYLSKGVQAPESAGDGVQVLQSSVNPTVNRFKDTAKGTIKTAQKSVKTAEKSAKSAVKTAKQTAKTAQKTAQATAKTAKAAEKAARAAARAAVYAKKAAVKAVAAMVKIAIAAIKGIVAALAAGGWIAVAIVLIICMIGLLTGSSFGIFFSGEDSGTGRTMPSVVAELTTEFYAQIEQIKAANPHDILEENAMSIYWPEVLAVYAVKVSTDPNGTEVATLDDDKVDMLRGVLHDMVSLSHTLRTDTREYTVTNDDGEETTKTETIVTLIITLTQKSVDEMITEYGFNQAQKDQLYELLSPDYADLWARLLGGYVSDDGTIYTGSGGDAPKGIFSWPFANSYPIMSYFGYRKDPFSDETEYHSGVDIGAPSGVPILAAADGTVVVANSTDLWGGGYGYYVKIQHTGGYATLYAHASTISVVRGQEVKKGQVIAYVGSTGRSTGPHLHWEVYKDGVRTDPLEYFS